MANVDFGDFEIGKSFTIDDTKGWRLEQTANGFYRWRWQMKTPNGEPIKYTTSGGKIGYKRGSKYIKRNEEESAGI